MKGSGNESIQPPSSGSSAEEGIRIVRLSLTKPTNQPNPPSRSPSILQSRWRTLQCDRHYASRHCQGPPRPAFRALVPYRVENAAILTLTPSGTPFLPGRLRRVGRDGCVWSPVGGPAFATARLSINATEQYRDYDQGVSSLLMLGAGTSCPRHRWRA